MLSEFRSCAVPFARNPFDELFASVRFEDTGQGRQGAVLVRPDDAGVPLVRTTTRYQRPAQTFRPVHLRLAEQLGRFDNALVECYASAYATMGSHSDQALDLAHGSTIAVFSCYRDPAQPPRKLLVESKEVAGRTFEVPLTHLTAVVFSLDTNRRHRHRIVLDAPGRRLDNRWLGFTFRTSATRVRWRDGRAELADGTPLTLADDDQRSEFYRLRGRENRELDFAYPRITYTLSESDLSPPDEL